VNKHAEVNNADDNVNAAFILAAHDGAKDEVQLLIDQGASVNHVASLGFTALIFAAVRGHKDVVQLLIEHGAEIEIENDEGQRPLEMYAKDPLAIEGDRDERLRDVMDLMKLYDEVSNSVCNKLPSLDEVVGRVSESFKGQGSNITVIKVS
jgi:ankyrin repeat protein